MCEFVCVCVCVCLCVCRAALLERMPAPSKEGAPAAAEGSTPASEGSPMGTTTLTLEVRKWECVGLIGYTM